MDKFNVKKLSINEVDKVYELEKKYIGECDIKSIENTIESSTLSYYVLFKDNDVIGFFECSIISPEAELYDIVIDEKYQGLGYSKILMDYFLNLVKESKVETIFLEVNSINNIAISHYIANMDLKNILYEENIMVIMMPF